MPKKGKIKDTEILNRKDDVFIVLWQSTNDGKSECHQQQQSEFSQKGENHCSAFPHIFSLKTFF